MNFRNACWLVILAILECSWRTSSSNIPKEALPEVEASLFSQFGFKSRPKVDKSKIFVPEALKKMYEIQMGFPLDTASIPRRGLHTKSANTIRSFIHSESRIDSKFPGHHKFRLKFDISTVPKEERLQAAEVTLNRQIVESVGNENLGKAHFQWLLALDIVKPAIKGTHGAITRVIDSKLIDTRKNSTISLDVFPAAQRWVDDPKKNYGLLIVILGIGRNKTTPARHVRLRRNTEESDTWNAVQPLLLTYTDDGKNKQRTGSEMAEIPRRRRAAKRHNRRRDEKREPCSRHKMYVDFSEVGWSDWIVAPPGYDAYYCHGECNFPLADHLNTTNHAIVQTLMNSVSPSKVPKTCCVPTQLNSISMLYLDDENKVVLKNYKEMVAMGCGCR